MLIIFLIRISHRLIEYFSQNSLPNRKMGRLPIFLRLPKSYLYQVLISESYLQARDSYYVQPSVMKFFDFLRNSLSL